MTRNCLYLRARTLAQPGLISQELGQAAPWPNGRRPTARKSGIHPDLRGWPRPRQPRVRAVHTTRAWPRLPWRSEVPVGTPAARPAEPAMGPARISET